MGISQGEYAANAPVCGCWIKIVVDTLFQQGSISKHSGNMNKKTYFISGGFFILGLLFGTIPCLVYTRKITNNEIFRREKAIAEPCLLATDAYINESKPMAICDLVQHLDYLESEEQFDKINDSVEITLTEGQLAQLYRDLGQTKRSAMFVTHALENAKVSGPRWVTNQAMLDKWVEKNAMDASNRDHFWSSVFTN